MSEVQRLARRQERLETLCAAAIRAVAGERDLHFRGGRLHRGRRALPLYAPHLATAHERDDLASLRGAGDAFALRLANNDAALHERLAPTEPVERLVFELLEQFRCESQVPAALAGVRGNLQRRFEAWSLAFHGAGGLESARGLLLFTLAQMARARLTGDAVPEPVADALEATRAGIAPLIGEALAGCRRERADQAAFAPPARAVARTIAALLQADAGDADATAAPIDDRDAWAAFTLPIAGSEPPAADAPTAVSGRSRVLDAADDGYRVFTRAHDREVGAATLVRAEWLREHRALLDRRLRGLDLNLAHLARDLQALLAVPAPDGWSGGEEVGRIDGRRLAQLVASPTERRLFRIERDEPRTDAIVSVLIDCSGSMKAHAEAVALLVDGWVRALEQAGAASEVLGFTTGAWNGGRARRDWLRAGRPAHPGRLNEACHIVFKAAAAPWRRARAGIAALLKADLFREGIDGEAVAWAGARLAARNETRRLLLVVSDGSPMDAATALANDAHYLDQHLKESVAALEARGIEVFGVGVGLDLSPYYGRSHVLDLTGGVGRAAFRELVAMIAGRARR